MPFLRQHIILEELGLTPLWLSHHASQKIEAQAVDLKSFFSVTVEKFAAEAAAKTVILLWQNTTENEQAAALMQSIALACVRVFACEVLLVTLSKSPPLLADWQAQNLPKVPILAFGSAVTWLQNYDLAATHCTIAAADACDNPALKAQIWQDCQHFFVNI